MRDVVCPWIKSVLENGFDASSEVHALAVSSLLHQLSQHCKNDLSSIYDVIMAAFQDKMGSVCLPLIKSPPLYHGSGVFISSQVANVVKYLNNIALLQGFINEADISRYGWTVLTRQLQGPLTKLLEMEVCIYSLSVMICCRVMKRRWCVLVELCCDFSLRCGYQTFMAWS